MWKGWMDELFLSSSEELGPSFMDDDGRWLEEKHGNLITKSDAGGSFPSSATLALSKNGDWFRMD
jgi:hypothetical protein